MSTIVPMSMCTIVLMMAPKHEHDRSQGIPILSYVGGLRWSRLTVTPLIAWPTSALRSNGLRRKRKGCGPTCSSTPLTEPGEEHVAVVGSQSRKRVDLKALADEIGASVGPTIKPAPAVKSERPGTPNNISDCARNVQRAGGRSRKIQGPHRRGAPASRHR